MSKYAVVELILSMTSLISLCFAFREKNNLKQTIERLEANIMDWNERYEELCQEQKRTLKDYLQMESDVLRSMRAELEDEYNSREGADRRLADLRTEVS